MIRMRRNIKPKWKSHIRKRNTRGSSRDNPLTAVNAWEQNAFGYKVSGTSREILNRIVELSSQQLKGYTETRINDAIRCMAHKECDNVNYCGGGESENTCGGTGVCFDIGCMGSCTQEKNGKYNCQFKMIY